jgi:hypothetical protein
VDSVGVLIVGRAWQVRALLRAQLIEDGFDVLAVDDWAAATTLLLSLGLPRVTVLILDEEPDPAGLLREAFGVLPRHRVVVLTSAGALPIERVHAADYPHALARPYAMADAIALVRRVAAEA